MKETHQPYLDNDLFGKATFEENQIISTLWDNIDAKNFNTADQELRLFGIENSFSRSGKAN